LRRCRNWPQRWTTLCLGLMLPCFWTSTSKCRGSWEIADLISWPYWPKKPARTLPNTATCWSDLAVNRFKSARLKVRQIFLTGHITLLMQNSRKQRDHEF
jgi:hypothetical protein